MTPAPPARVHLLPAHKAPVVVVLRRGPSKIVHVMRWNTETDEIEHGSWFRGRLYEMRCDVSYNGEWMVYLAMGSRGETWSGICQLPFLRTTVHWRNTGTWHGGGVFHQAELKVNAGYAESDMRRALQGLKSPVPFKIVAMPHSPYGEDEGVLYPRLQRDRWHLDREGSREWRSGWGLKPIPECPQWSLRPSPKHPELLLWQRGYVLSKGRVFQFSMPQHEELFDESVTWACYDAKGQLLIARAGVLEKYTLEDLARGTPSFRYDTNGLEPPERGPLPSESEKRLTFEVHQGPATDADAAALALQHPSDESSLALALAGQQAQEDFFQKTSNGLMPNRVLTTPPYYLRYNALLHVSPTTPRTAIRAIFVAAARNGLFSVAIGSAITKGKEAECVKATFDLLSRFEDEAGGRIVFVANDPAQAEALDRAIQTMKTEGESATSSA